MYWCDICIFFKAIGKLSINQSIIYRDSYLSKENFAFFDMFTGISPPAALFVGRSLMIAFICSAVAVKEKISLCTVP